MDERVVSYSPSEARLVSHSACSRLLVVARMPLPPERRSRINPCFHLADPGDTAHFLAAAAAAGLDDLQGHPALGGIRASLYNGLSEAAVAALVGFLDAYAPRVSARAA